MAGKRKAVDTDMQAENERLKQQLADQASQQAALVGQLARMGAPVRQAGGLYVGVRNVSAYTISIPSPFAGEAELLLHAPGEMPNPNTVAVVSYAWWQQLRRSKIYDRGMIIRDDAVMGDSYQAAPADRPEDCAPNHKTNLVLDARQWMDSRTETKIAKDIKAMTSEQSLRKLEAMIYLERQRLMEERLDMPWNERKQSVELAMPGKMRALETAVKARLAVLRPAVIS
jgi:hypothetical protein